MYMLYGEYSNLDQTDVYSCSQYVFICRSTSNAVR